MPDPAFRIAAFYKFVAVDDPPELRRTLAERCRGLGVIGTILLAPEGINGTIAAAPQRMDEFLAWLKSDPRFADLEVKRSVAQTKPFKRMKVRLKREIVTLRVPEADPNVRCGTYLEPRAWNELIAEPDVVLIDTRNTYEFQIGTFAGAIDPKTASFGEFPRYVAEHADELKGKKIAMFCTGGIRCEKATAYMKWLGYEDVYHLKGGILRYLEEMPACESRWQGECYVFDERVAVTEGVIEGRHTTCPACGRPVVKGEPCGSCAGK